jgi:hypothetical protein
MVDVGVASCLRERLADEVDSIGGLGDMCLNVEKLVGRCDQFTKTIEGVV